MKYREFILYKCNDGISYNIFHKNSDGNGEHLICTVGSFEKAKQWVDEWHKNFHTERN